MKRELTFYLIVDWRRKAVRVLKKKPFPSGGDFYAKGYKLGEIPIEVNLTLNVPDDPVLTLDAEVTVTETAMSKVFLRDITDE